MMLKTCNQLKRDIQDFAFTNELELIGKNNVYNTIALNLNIPNQDLMEILKGQEFFYLDSYLKLCEYFTTPFQFSIEYPADELTSQENGTETLTEEIAFDLALEEKPRKWLAFFDIKEYENMQYYNFYDYDIEDNEEDLKMERFIKNMDEFFGEEYIETPKFEIYTDENWVRLPLKDIYTLFEYQAKIDIK
ncbi:hypothetical protein [Pseudostreptobacillus hongkongensis]|uniref:hypothetical protein n=1 Tax=Pseudostreptobacillus hongkongensis TaxID=1162717 RepID=UPI00083472BB|nr:hypothetical protein [Pseudostreptobacillus hongkongensis]